MTNVSKEERGRLLWEMCGATASDDQNVAAILPKRIRESNKGTYGRAAIVAGCIDYTGAAYLSAMGCLRAGAGYTALFLPKNILPYYILKAPEILLKTISDGERLEFKEENFKQLLGYDVIAYGMGMGESKAVSDGAKYLLQRFTGKLIIDADGLNSLVKYEKGNFSDLFGNKNCDVLLTPHIKEFARLTGKTVEEIIRLGVQAPTEFAKRHKVTVLLKNAYSVITDGEHIAINTSGCSAQATGGTGDVLSGVIAGLCAEGATCYDGARAAAYLLGRAAELAAKDHGEYSATPTDFIAYLGKAFLSIQG